MRNVNNIDIVDSEKSNTLIFSRETFDRAFPYVDGIKPIHRRILWAMYESNTITFTKCANVVGKTMIFHPHGDAAIYGALVRLGQPWIMNYTLVDVRGNKGDQSNSSGYAAARYTECKLSDFCRDAVVSDLDKVTVDFIDNYDYERLVPEYLSTKIPLVLLNGVNGIGVAYKTDIPPHNLNDIADRCIAYIKNKQISNEDLCDGLFPDFPTGGEILNGRELENFYKHQIPCNISIRGKAELDTSKNMIVLTEFPYGVDIDDITAKISAAVKSGNMILSGILSIQDNNHHNDDEDDSDTSKKKKNKRTTYEYSCKKDANMLEILNEIGKVSDFKTTVQVSFMVNVNGYPKYVTVKDIISDWYDVRSDSKRRRYQRNVTIAQEKLHLYEGILSIYPRKEEVVKFISGNKGTSREEVIDQLHKKFKLSKTQARGIYDMPLGTLSGFGEHELEVKIENLKDTIAENDSNLLRIDEIIIQELEELKAKYGRPRKTTVLMDYQEKKSEKPVVSKGQFLYSHTSLGLLDINGCNNSKSLINGMRAYKGSGKGIREIIGGSVLEGTPIGFVVCYSDSTIQLIDSSVFRVLNVWYDTKCDEKDQYRCITAACPYYKDSDEFVCLTDDFKVKRISLSDLSKRASNSGGKIIKIIRNDIDDERIDCLIVGMTSKGAGYLVVPLDDIPVLGRAASGVKTSFECESNKIFISLIDIGSSTEMSRFFVGTEDSEGQGYIHGLPIDSLKITGRTNKPKQLTLPKDQTVSGLIIGGVDNREENVYMFGKSSSTSLSVNNFKKPFNFKRLYLTMISGGVL